MVTEWEAELSEEANQRPITQRMQPEPMRKVRDWHIERNDAERLRERQEAAGNGLRNQNERGGCLLFARRNGSAKCVLESNGALPIDANRKIEPTLVAVLCAMKTG
jgi:hypothetical protein